MSHASMLKARRRRQKSKKLIDGEAKRAKRLAKIALKGPAVKKVKKPRVKKEKVETETVKKAKPTKEEPGKKDAKKGSAGAGETA